jgi:hypothetical protein
MSELVVERCVDSEEMRRSEVQDTPKAWSSQFTVRFSQPSAFCLQLADLVFVSLGGPVIFTGRKENCQGRRGEIDARS